MAILHAAHLYVHVATQLYWQVNRLRAGMNLARLNVQLPN